jgi:hypothetical protein
MVLSLVPTGQQDAAERRAKALALYDIKAGVYLAHAPFW